MQSGNFYLLPCSISNAKAAPATPGRSQSHRGDDPSGGRPDCAVGRAHGPGQDHGSAGDAGASLGRVAGPSGRKVRGKLSHRPKTPATSLSGNSRCPRSLGLQHVGSWRGLLCRYILEMWKQLENMRNQSLFGELKLIALVYNGREELGLNKFPAGDGMLFLFL